MPPEAGNLRLLRHLRRLRSRLVPSPAPAPAASTTQERVKAAGSFAACGRTVRCAVCASAQAALMRAGSSRQRRASRRSARWRRVLASLKLAAVIKLAALGSVQHTCARRFACGPRCCAQPEPFCIIFRHLALSRCDELRGSDVVEATLERALRRAQSRPQRGQRKRTAFVCCAHRPTARPREARAAGHSSVGRVKAQRVGAGGASCKLPSLIKRQCRPLWGARTASRRPTALGCAPTDGEGHVQALPRAILRHAKPRRGAWRQAARPARGPLSETASPAGAVC